jgi:hypothetical protein
MKVFQLRQRLIDDYGTYVRSFIEIRDARIRARVREELDGALLSLEEYVLRHFASAEAFSRDSGSGVNWDCR